MWDLEFTERKPLDGAVDEELTASDEKSFRSLYQCLLAHADGHQSVGSDGAPQVSLKSFSGVHHLKPQSALTVCRAALQSIWVVLGESGTSVKSLVAVLSSFILGGKSKGASVQQRVTSLWSASLYLLLLTIPGEHSRVMTFCTNTKVLCDCVK